MAVTMLKDLVNPTVVADTITAGLPAAIKMTPVCEVNRDLVGTPGNTISVPVYEYIGDATDVAEGVAIDVSTLTATSTQATVKKVGKAVTLTDEAALSGTGDPINEATNQLKISIASKVDNDILASLQTTTQSVSGVFSLGLVSSALDVFEDEELGERKFLFVNPAMMGILRMDETFTHASELGDRTLMTGSVGTVFGCEVIPTRKIVAPTTGANAGVYPCVLAKERAVALYLKREVNVETGRDVLKKETVISADEHYVTTLRDASRAVLIKATLTAPEEPSTPVTPPAQEG